jgi:peptide/nickel transport system substrate-binding protein
MTSFRRNQRALRFSVILAGLALVVGACAPTGAPPPGRDQAGTPTPGGRVIYGNFADAKTFNYVLLNDTASGDVADLMYESLVDDNPKTGEPVPRLAQKWEVASDGLTYTFTLRDGLKWSDGSAFSGEDFKFTAEAVMRSKLSPRKSLFQDIVGAKDYADGKADNITGITVSGNTITVKLTKAFCPFLTNTGGFKIMPKAEFGKYMDPMDASKNVDQAAENKAPKLGMGPFLFKEWKPNDQVVMVRNDNFFLGKPLLDEFVMKVYPSQPALAGALKTGEIDLAAAQPSDFEDLQRAENLNSYVYLTPGYTYIGWNQLRGGKEFFQSKNIRLALAHGLDMKSVVDKILFGHGQQMFGHIPPVSWAYDPTGLADYKYDRATAEQLIQADGWTKGSDGIYQKGGQKLEFGIATNSGNKVRETLLQVAIEQYRQIGINVTAKPESFEALVDRLTKSKDPKYGDQGGKDFDAVIIGWALGADPDPYGIWHSSQIGQGNNFVGYKNAAVDQALEDGRTKCDQGARKDSYKSFSKQVNEDQPYNFGFAQKTLLFANKKIQGIDPGSYFRIATWNIEKWWVKQ